MDYVVSSLEFGKYLFENCEKVTGLESLSGDVKQEQLILFFGKKNNLNKSLKPKNNLISVFISKGYLNI